MKLQQQNANVQNPAKAHPLEHLNIVNMVNSVGLKADSRSLKRTALAITISYFAFVSSCVAASPSRDTPNEVANPPKSDVDTLSSREELWVMGALALSAEAPNVGPDDNVLGFSYHAGLTWKDQILLFANHSIRGSFSNGVPSEEHRYEYALLYGLNRRDRAGFLYAAAGPSYVNYSLRGAERSGSTPLSPSFATVSGSALGLGVSAGVYLTPVRGWGALGLGVHASLLHKHSFVAIEISLIELNILLSD